MKDVDVYSAGLCHCSVCIPKEMKPEDMVAEVNNLFPTGISSSWALSEDKEFANGDPHPKVCETDPTRLHYLLVC